MDCGISCSGDRASAEAWQRRVLALLDRLDLASGWHKPCPFLDLGIRIIVAAGCATEDALVARRGAWPFGQQDRVFFVRAFHGLGVGEGWNVVGFMSARSVGVRHGRTRSGKHLANPKRITGVSTAGRAGGQPMGTYVHYTRVRGQKLAGRKRISLEFSSGPSQLGRQAVRRECEIHTRGQVIHLGLRPPSLEGEGAGRMSGCVCAGTQEADADESLQSAQGATRTCGSAEG